MKDLELIDINHVSEEDLVGAGIDEISEDRAHNLVEYRTHYGPFETWNDVLKVPGFNEEVVDTLRASGAALNVPSHKEVDDDSKDYRDFM